MGTALNVNVSGTWKTVVEPYINVNGTWKTVHNVWVKKAGTWELAHRTPHTRYSVGTTVYSNRNDEVNDYTVPSGVRYLGVNMYAGGGGGGAGADTGGAGYWSGHYGCSGGSANIGGGFHNHSAGGGTGGKGGKINIIFEVRPGDRFHWSFGSKGTGGQTVSRLELPSGAAGGLSIVSAGTSATGSSGAAGANIHFSDTGPQVCFTRFTAFAYGGSPGTGGKVNVDSNCTTAGTTWGYTVSETDGSTGADGSQSVSVTTGDMEVQTLTTGGGRDGGLGGGSTAYPGAIGHSSTQSALVTIQPYS